MMDMDDENHDRRMPAQGDAQAGASDQSAVLSRVREAALVINAGLSLDDVLRQAVHAARELVQARYAALGVAREDLKGLERFVVDGMTSEQIQAIGDWPRGLGLLGVLLREPKPLRVPVIADDSRSIGFPPNHPPMKSFLGVPITLRGRILGNFYLTDKIGAPEFSQADEDIVVLFAAHAALAIENARLFTQTDQELQRKVADLQRAQKRAVFLAELASILPGHPAVEEVPLEVVAQSATEVLGDAAGVYLVESDYPYPIRQRAVYHRDPTRAAAAERLVDGAWETLARMVIGEGRAIAIRDISLPRPKIAGLEPEVMRSERFTAVMALPLRTPRGTYGVFATLASQPATFSEEDHVFAGLVAERLAISMENSKLLAEVRERAAETAEERERLRATIESVADEVWICDAEGTLVWLNAAAAQGLGLPEAKELYQPLPEVLPRLEVYNPDGTPLPPEETPLLRSLRGEVIKNQEDMVRNLQTGDLYWRQTSSAPIKADGRIVGAVAVVRDVTERRRAEEALRKSEAKFRTLFESIDEGFCIIEVLFDENEKPVDYRFLEVNPSFERQTGIENAVGRRMREIAPLHEEHWFQIYGRIALTGEPERFENPAEQLHRYYDVYAFRVGEPAQRRVAILFNDITERRRAEEALRESEERFRRTFDQSPIGVVIVSLDYRFLRVNDEFCRIVGHSAEDLMATGFPEITHPDDLEADMRQVYRLEAGEIDSYRMDKRFIRKDGGIAWTRLSAGTVKDAAGHPMYFLSMIEDIAESKQAEAERERLLAEMEQHAAELETIINATATGIIIYYPDGRIARANQATERILGYTQDALRRMSRAERIEAFRYETPEGSPLPIEEVPSSRALRGEAVHDFLMVVHRVDSRKVWLSASAAPFFDQDGRRLGAVVSFTDITALREAQEAREDFVRTISHDLRNPLTPVMGLAQWLERSLAQKGLEGEAKSAETIGRSARRMSSMITDLVDSARLETGKLELKREPLDLIQFTSELMERIGTPDDRARLHLEAPEWVPPVLADRERLERVVMNLITNALKYSTPGTPVVVHLGQMEGQAVLSVTDQGVGIAPEEQRHLFQRYYRADSGKKVEGLGLGLYISRLLIEAHGGRVWVESELGKGSTFYVALPLGG